jgi:hypothetical protein
VRTAIETFFDVLAILVICIIKNKDGVMGYFELDEFTILSDYFAISWWVILAVVFSLFTGFVIYSGLVSQRKYALLRLARREVRYNPILTPITGSI